MACRSPTCCAMRRSAQVTRAAADTPLSTPSSAPAPPPKSRPLRTPPVMVSPQEAKEMASRPVPVSLPDALSLRVAAGQAACVPELVNARCAMLGTLWCLGAELAASETDGGQTLLQQGEANAPAVAALVVAITLASLAPVMQGARPAERTLLVLTPSAELWNGRAAMAGFLSILVLERLGGSTMF